MTSPWRARLGWAVVLIAGCVMGGWIARSRLGSGPNGLLPRDSAELAIATTPEVAFVVEVRRDVPEAVPRLFDGKQSMTLEPGDYYVDVVPTSLKHQRKRLKVHLSSNQKLALPVVLNASSPPVFAAPAPTPPPQPLPPEPAPPPTLQPVAAPHTDDFNDVLDNHAGVVPLAHITLIRGRVADAKPVLEGKSIDREALARYVRSRKAAILGCYEKELRRFPTLKGKVVVHFVITQLGRASEIAIEEDTMGNEAVASCVKSIIRGWVFPFKPDVDVPVGYPFVFSPADETPAR